MKDAKAADKGKSFKLSPEQLMIDAIRETLDMRPLYGRMEDEGPDVRVIRHMMRHVDDGNRRVGAR